MVLPNVFQFQGKDSNARVKQLESDITFHIGKQEAELALKVNSAAYNGDLYQLKGLIRTGADPNKTDYDGRSPLVRVESDIVFTFGNSWHGSELAFLAHKTVTTLEEL